MTYTREQATMISDAVLTASTLTNTATSLLWDFYEEYLAFTSIKPLIDAATYNPDSLRNRIWAIHHLLTEVCIELNTFCDDENSFVQCALRDAEEKQQIIDLLNYHSA